jgi:hypothetical protein
MFVRWQQYRSQALNPWQRERNDRSARLKAVLVESVRVKRKPRQRHIAFLGSIELDDPRMISGDSDYARFWRRMSERRKARFWRDVTLRLARLGNRVAPEDHERITAALAKKVEGRLMTAAELELEVCPLAHRPHFLRQRLPELPAREQLALVGDAHFRPGRAGPLK